MAKNRTVNTPNSDIWNFVPSCLMWTIWTECNWCSFEDTENSLAQFGRIFKYKCNIIEAHSI